MLGLSCSTWGLRWGVLDLSLWHVSFFLVMSCRFSLCSCGTQVPEHMGSVVCGMRALLLRCVSSVVVARGFSCPATCGILVPRPMIEPTSPALEGRFFTTGPPGSPLDVLTTINFCLLSLSPSLSVSASLFSPWVVWLEAHQHVFIFSKINSFTYFSIVFLFSILLIFSLMLIFSFFLAYFFFLSIYLFIYGCVGSSFLCEGFL